MLSADKGNCVVVMDKHQYPTSKTQRKLNKMSLDLKKAGIINEDLYRMLYSSDGLSPRFYGLQKIHKTGIPLRAIVSLINYSPSYDVSSYLAKILSPVVGNTGNTVKNSLEFADFIRGKTAWASTFNIISTDVRSCSNQSTIV